MTTEQTEDTPEPEEPTTDDTPATEDTHEDPETFPREYVENLRQENGKYRQRAADRDEIAHRLHSALVTATGRLADATDLTFDDSHLTDPEALTAAIDALLSAKPHLASRKPTGDIGQGVTAGSDTFSLSGLLRNNAR